MTRYKNILQVAHIFRLKKEIIFLVFTYTQNLDCQDKWPLQSGVSDYSWKVILVTVLTTKPSKQILRPSLWQDYKLSIMGTLEYNTSAQLQHQTNTFSSLVTVPNYDWQGLSAHWWKEWVAVYIIHLCTICSQHKLFHCKLTPHIALHTGTCALNCSCCVIEITF